MLPDGGQDASTKDFTAALPSAVKNQALRDARSVWRRSFELASIPVLRRPIWGPVEQPELAHRRGHAPHPCLPAGRVGQITLRVAAPGLGHAGPPARSSASGASGSPTSRTPSPQPEHTIEQGVMGRDLGVKVPAVVHVIGKGTRFCGNWALSSGRNAASSTRVAKHLQRAKKVRAVRKSQGKERRWMRDVNHKLSRQIVCHAQAQGVGIIRLERLAGIRHRSRHVQAVERKPAKTTA